MLQGDPAGTLAFLAVVEHKSFRAAARALGIPKSTVSQRVAHLEEQLGVRLLARTTRSVTLTDIGASYEREVSPAIAALHAAELAVHNLKAHPSGRVRLSAPVELGQAILGELLGKYTRLYPEVRLEVDLSDRVVQLVEEGYDVALRVGPLSDSGLVARPWGTPQHLGVYGSVNYLRKARAPELPRDVVRHRCLLMSGTQGFGRWDFRHGRKTEIVNVEPFLAVNSYVVLSELVVQGVGLARLPLRYAGPLLAQKLVREVLAPFAPAPRPTYVVYPSARHLAPAVRALVDLLIEDGGRSLLFNDTKPRRHVALRRGDATVLCNSS